MHHLNTDEDEEATFIGQKKQRDFGMAVILANIRGYKIGDKFDGTVSEQVETGQNCSSVICDYKKSTRIV